MRRGSCELRRIFCIFHRGYYRPARKPPSQHIPTFTMTKPFRYEQAFARNIGWVTPAEQQQLRGKRVAIAGGGGVGGVHLLTLARLGVTKFRIADFDTFDVPNFNRQVGAMVSTLGQPKVEVIRRMLLDINPECEVEMFEQGINDANLNAFLEGADMYVDALDFFAFDIRQKTFALCARLTRMPSVTNFS